MALQKDIASVFGITGNYIRIEEIHLKYRTDEVWVSYSVYKDATAAEDKQPLSRGDFAFSLPAEMGGTAMATGDAPAAMGDALTSTDMRDLAYTEMKSLTDFSDALDV